MRQAEHWPSPQPPLMRTLSGAIRSPQQAHSVAAEGRASIPTMQRSQTGAGRSVVRGLPQRWQSEGISVVAKSAAAVRVAEARRAVQLRRTRVTERHPAVPTERPGGPAFPSWTTFARTSKTNLTRGPARRSTSQADTPEYNRERFPQQNSTGAKVHWREHCRSRCRLSP